MKVYFLWILPVFVSTFAFAQKKPLDHTVYDGWQSIGEKLISADGKYVAYTVNPQEGDGVLVIQSSDGSYKKEMQRGYDLTITKDSRFVIFKIKPLFKDNRDAKIKKKKPDEMPHDSLAIFELGKDSVIKIPAIKTYRTPEKSAGWIAWLSEKPIPETAKTKPSIDSISQINSLSRAADSLMHIADSLRNKATEARLKGLNVLQSSKKENKKTTEDIRDEGTELILRNLYTGEEIKYALVKDYLFSKKGNRLAIATTKKASDSLGKAYVLWVDLVNHKTDTVMKGLHELKNFAMDEEAGQLAFVAERDSLPKALRKYYNLWYYKSGMDSAQSHAGTSLPGMSATLTISENYALQFSCDGKRLFFGVAPIRSVKDTTQPDFEKAAVDIWNYKDDDLQPVQLKNLEKDLKKSFTAVWDIATGKIIQLGDEKFPEIMLTAEGNGAMGYTSSDFGKRIARQWQGFALRDVYAVNTNSGEKKMIVADFKGDIYPSYSGKYLLLYDERQKKYSMYNSETGTLYVVAADVQTKWYDEENDMPDDPNAYGIAGWEKNDKHVLIYDRYRIWQIDPEGKEKSTQPRMIAAFSRKPGSVCRYVKLDRDEKYIDLEKDTYYRVYNEKSKSVRYVKVNHAPPFMISTITGADSFLCNGLIKADSADVFIYTAENYSSSPDLYCVDSAHKSPRPGDIVVQGWYVSDLPEGKKLSHLNSQQSKYLWGSAELFTWKAYTGKKTEGILYKPEHFDSTKKYPMIVYYYERNNNTLLYYQSPAPTPSRLNIPFFVSRGYIVFVPDIWYINGHPGKSAYDYIMSGTRALIRKGFVDSAKIGLQGQSWGGYQTAYLITQTHLFAAAWAGAPVVNMFSAYGGIRWESGVNRQFQYEKTQSRIGATIWERPDLYIENSPLFHLPKITTPLVIMSNDADGAVPWYQGIEFFTAMRRLNKPVWLLSYNGEAHNLVERKNRKDIQIREQQFFDWLLKGEKPPVWITEGVPATLKGIDWGMEVK